jgi:hypothetical protein
LDQPTQGAGSFVGTRRFIVERQLGAGATGVVYQVLDRERQMRVALKTLRSFDAEALYALKREFRSLADLAHPNLIQLHELVFEDERWFITMELVDGVDFLRHVRGPDGLDVARLRAALGQLAVGVQALHAAGKLHRDIKPSNALVAREGGRVVLLDFGLVAELTPSPGAYQTVATRLVGTPAYLAPEQADCQPPAPASDWYSVGVMLYEALTGELPFDGSVTDILRGKLERDPPPPRARVPDVPPDLDHLCMSLLRRLPAARPEGPEVLERLRAVAAPAPAAPPREAGAPAPRGPWVGRRGELARLAEAFAVAERGAPIAVFVQGGSGMGKSTLAQRFLDGLMENAAPARSSARGAVVLTGRCYERELVPYRALDSAIDALSRYLLTLPRAELEGLLPRDTLALTRLFPVLRRVDGILRGPRGAGVPSDAHALRQRAFDGLRELLARLTDRRAVVLFIDDLQWGDADSAALLAHLLAPPQPPAIMLLACYRDEDPAARPLLAHLRGGGLGVRVEDLVLGPLDADEARELARACLTPSASGAGDVADAIAREAGGSPFFVRELASQAPASGGPAPAVTALDDLLRARVARLDERSRRLLVALAVAGRPLDLELALRVAGLPPGDLEAPNALRSARLGRLRGARIEIAHDRVRASVLAGLSADEAREQHRRLAEALRAAPDVDPETLAQHLEGAGELGAAAEQVALAASRADEALAFDRAVRLYQRALGLQSPEPSKGSGPPAMGSDRQSRSTPDASAGKPPGDLHQRLGDALANAGFGAEAAHAYLTAATTAEPSVALELRRRASEQLLRVGHLDEGLEALRTVLAAIGVKLARTPRRALLSLLLRRARARLLGLDLEPHQPAEPTPEALTRLDIYWSVSTTLGIIDNIRATDFQTRHLLLARKLGDPYRLSRALAAEASYSAVHGGRGRRRTARLLRAAEDVAARVEEPFAHGWVTLAAGFIAFLEGRFRQARDRCEQAEAVFRDCVGVWWEVGSARLFSLWSIFYLGDLPELARRQPVYLKEAEERGDLYTATSLRLSVLGAVWLAADDPERARAEADGAMARWSRHGYHSPHYWHMVGDVSARLYAGEPREAWERVRRDWAPLRRSLLLRVQQARIEFHALRGRAALALATATPPGRERDALLAEARASVRRVRREHTRWGTSLSQLLAAGVAAQSGDGDGARAALAEAASGFDAADMALHAAVARRCDGHLRGGAAGAADVTRADAWLAGAGVKNPARFVRLIAPGLGEP